MDIDTILNIAQAGIDLGSKLIAAASVVTAITPTPSTSHKMSRIYRLIETTALLIGHARDKK